MKDILKKILLLSLCFSIVACSQPNNMDTDNPNNNDLTQDETDKDDNMNDNENSNKENNFEDNTSTDDEDDIVINNEDIYDGLNQEQKNSVAMLYYLSFIAEELKQAKDNRLALEEVYTTLLNNTEPEKIDELTQDHINNLLDVIKRYRMVSIKRDRLQYIYNQDKASSISEAIPDPLSVLSVAASLDWKKLVLTIGYTAIDSYNNYKKANSEIDKEFFISGWELDDEESDAIDKNRERAFNYMTKIVREYSLSKGQSLNELSVQQFVEYCNETNVHRKIQFLESEENTYMMFGSYWLELADAYYETEEYEKCLKCIQNYQDLYTGIFRKDYEYALLLPKAIVAAQNVYSGNEYIIKISKFAKDILDNTENNDWASRYFVAQVYLDLYSKTDDKSYLDEVYKIALNNTNQLVDYQIELNNTYLNDVVELELEKVDDTYLTKEEKDELKKEQKQQQKELDKYNKSLKEKRKTELPSLYEPLILNCDLLFAVAKELEISNTEKSRIIGILSDAFISEIISDRYSFNDTNEYNIIVNKNNVIISANLLNEGMNVQISIKNGNDIVNIDDLNLSKVERENTEISSFMAYYESKTFKKYEWKKGVEVIVELSYGVTYEPIVLKYKVTKFDDKGWLPDEVVFEKYE